MSSIYRSQLNSPGPKKLDGENYKVPSMRDKQIKKLTMTLDDNEIEKELVSDKVIASNDDPTII